MMFANATNFYRKSGNVSESVPQGLKSLCENLQQRMGRSKSSEMRTFLIVTALMLCIRARL